MKYFVFSIDDGTIYDADVISLFNAYGIRATFNLNSGLNNFTWYLGDIPITRFDLNMAKDLYIGHEVASHSLTHPYLDSISDEEVINQVNEDVNNLNTIFNREITSFATPFETCGDREVNLIKDNTPITCIRLSCIDESFTMPIDSYHVKVTALDIDRALYLFDSFINADGNSVFIYAGHSYDFYVGDSFDKLELLLQKIKEHDDISVITIKELSNIINTI